MIIDKDIINSFDTKITVAVLNYLDHRGMTIEKFGTLPDEEIKQDLIKAYRSLKKILPSLEDIPVRATTLIGAGAVALIDKNGFCGVILLNKDIFGSCKKEALEKQDKGYDVKTDNPIGATLIHEFGHAIWTPRLQTNNEIDYAILTLYIEWKKEYDAGILSEYGEYAVTDIKEWWAETFAKAIVGTPDKFTQKLINIIKEHLL